MARRKSNPDDRDTAPSFEEALASLESIVDAMENEQLPLEDLVSHYERGAELLGRCESLLATARERIQLITLRAKSESGMESGNETSATSPSLPSSAQPDETDDDDIRLF